MMELPGYLAPGSPGMMPMGPQRTARPWERNLEEERQVEPARVAAADADERYLNAKGYAVAGVVVLGFAALVTTVLLLARKDDKPASVDKKDGVYTQKEVFADLKGA